MLTTFVLTTIVVAPTVPRIDKEDPRLPEIFRALEIPDPERRLRRTTSVIKETGCPDVVVDMSAYCLTEWAPLTVARMSRDPRLLRLLLKAGAHRDTCDVQLKVIDPDPKGANVRAKPSGSAKITTTLPLGALVKGVAAYKGWLRILVDGHVRGWMWGALLEAAPARENRYEEKPPIGMDRPRHAKCAGFWFRSEKNRKWVYSPQLESLKCPMTYETYRSELP